MPSALLRDAPAGSTQLLVGIASGFVPGAMALAPSSRLTRRPPSPAAAPRGRPCHSLGPGSSLSSWAAALAPSKPLACPPKVAPRLRICAPNRSQVQDDPVPIESAALCREGLMLHLQARAGVGGGVKGGR